jgi:RND family efflux transporter MFP subunit
MGRGLKTFIISAGIILVGVAGFVVLKATKPAPPEKKSDRARLIVRVMPVKTEDVQATVEESGTVEPKTTLDVTAEVAGSIIYVSENLRQGYFVAKDELLVEIDPREYRLSIAQAKAQIAQSKAEMAKTQQERENIKRNITVEKDKLALSKSELERMKRLLKSGSLSQSEIDKQAISTRGMEVSFLAQQNALALLKSQEDVIRAKIEATEAQLEIAQIKLDKTKIRAPFPGRVREETADTGEFVSVGQKLATIYDITAMEVVVNVPPRKAGLLIEPSDRPEGRPRFTSPNEVNEWIKKIGPPATVSFRWGDRTATWKGKLTRLKGSLDEATRTVPMVIEVKNPFKDARPGVRPPLLPGMFVDVVLKGRLFKDVAKVPRSALHEGSVYLVVDGKLRIQKVKVEMMTREEAIVSEGLKNGDKVILSPLAVPIPGMELRVAS